MDNNAAIWEEAERALIVGDIDGLEQLLREHKRLFREELPPTRSGGLRPDYSGGDVREILLKNHQLEEWDNFSKNERFEAAVDAVVSGDEARLEELLRGDPNWYGHDRCGGIGRPCCTMWARMGWSIFGRRPPRMS